MQHGVTPTIAETALGIGAALLVLAAGLFVIYLIHGWAGLDNDDHHDTLGDD